MCEIVEKLCEERAHERTTEIARGLIDEGSFPLEKIAKALKLPLSEVQKLAEEMSGQPAAEKE
jgi:hypothetical protein